MTVINISQWALEQKVGTWFERRALRRDPDLFYISTLTEMEDYFAQHPPAKEVYPGKKAAYVAFINNMHVKRHFPDVFDEHDGISLAFLNEGLAAPLFDLRDVTAERIALWQAGDAADFFAAEAKVPF